MPTLNNPSNTSTCQVQILQCVLPACMYVCTHVQLLGGQGNNHKKKKKGKLEAYFCPEILILKCQAKSSS